MRIVDDHLAVLALAGALPESSEGDAVATTWPFQFRLARALADGSVTGSLSRRASVLEGAVRRATSPPAHRLLVLDPREHMAATVRLASQHGLNLLAADLMGAARHHGAAVWLTQGNLGSRWRSIMRAEGIELRVFGPRDLRTGPPSHTG